MRVYITKSEREKLVKQYKKDENCCLIKLNGSKLTTKELYFDKLKEKLRLNDTFSNNYNAYSDMMKDTYTYYNKDKIVFIIKHYDEFLKDDQSKIKIEKIFDHDIIPFFKEEIKTVLANETKKEFHVYCVK